MELSPLPPQPQQPPPPPTNKTARLTSNNSNDNNSSKNTTSTTSSSNSSSRKSSSGGGGTNNGSSFQGSLPLWKRVLVCSGMLALESYITYEEIYLTTTLQRFQVPYALLSVPGAVSGGCGIFMVPLLGWAMDRYKGNKRRFAIGTLTVLSLGMVVLIYTGTTSLYYPDPKLQSTNHDISFNNSVTGNGTVSANHSVGLDLNGDSSSSSGGSGSGNNVPVLTGILAMIGFVFSDQGYDTSTLTVRTYILSISPVSQHDSLLLTTTTMGAIGGCITSLVGFLNLSSLFPYVEGQVIDAGDAQFLVQSIIFVITLAVFFTGTLCANSQLFQKETDSFFVLAKTKKNQNGYKPLEGEQLFSIEELETKYLMKDTGTTNNNYDTERTPPTFEMTKFHRGSLPDLTRQDVLHSAHDKPEPEFDLKEDAQSSSEEEEPAQCLISKRTKSRLALMLMVFLVIIAMACYFFYITNYVAEIIYKGDPHAPAGSDPYEQYVLGTRVASLSMLTFYVVFVFYNVFHGKILDKIGMRAEFIITSISVTVLTTATVVTQNMIMVFVTMIPLAAYRSCCYTIPFILANKYAQQEHQELKKERKAAHRKGHPERALLPGDTTEEEEGEWEGEVEVSPTSGSAMASVTVMIPLTYCLVCIAAGPLIALTNDTALPIYVSIGAYGLGTFTAAIVDFD